MQQALAATKQKAEDVCWPPFLSSPNGGRRRIPPPPHPLPQAGEGVQGAALVHHRTPAARLACFHIKIQISGGCLNGATKERSEFRRTGRLQGSPFLSPISFGDAKEMGSAVGPRPDSLPQHKHTAPTRSKGPHPHLPPAGEGDACPLTPPLPQAGKGVNTKFIAASACCISARGIFHSKNQRL